ncbi:MAG: Uncharacterized protein G01um1014106_597 [Parcubacteria group bacterium Gr01-1014_106]|nr:MAG: Uncharacterized protein G01um1014106_597 [Parcubacteria group bacterium Gr01-1014_106]
MRTRTGFHRRTLGIRVALLFGALMLLGGGCVRPSSTAPTPPPEGGVYRSDDGGVTIFQKVVVEGGGVLSGIQPRQVELVPLTPDVLYLVAAEGLFRTTNAGERWEQLTIPAASVHSITVHPRNPNILLASGVAPAPNGRGKIWKSLTAGEAWEEVFTAPATRVETGTIVRRQREVHAVVNSVTHDTQAPEIVYAGTSTGALLISVDGGMHWQERYSFRQGVTGLKTSPTKSGFLLVRLADGTLVRSLDGGDTVDLVDLRRATDQQTGGLTGLSSGFGAPRDPANAVAFLRTPDSDDEGILVGTQSALFRSNDGGETWDQLRIPSSGTVRTPVISVAQSPNGILWAASGAIVFSSMDDGNTWRALDTPLQTGLRFLVADPARANRLYFVFSAQ